MAIFLADAVFVPPEPDARSSALFGRLSHSGLAFAAKGDVCQFVTKITQALDGLYFVSEGGFLFQAALDEANAYVIGAVFMGTI